MAAKKAIVLSGDGINCHQESAQALRLVGFEAEILHVNDFLADPAAALKDAKLFLLPGGFSFGDELGSGKILAIKLKHGSRGEIEKFLQRGGAMLGICNGFQVLTALGIFGESVALAHNASGRFIDRWVGLEVCGRSIFTDHIQNEHLDLPMRHGEGRLICTDEAHWSSLTKNGALVLRYRENVNGSREQIAALSAYDGRVLGMMPHPEAFWSAELHPSARSYGGILGLELFKGAYRSL